MAIGLISCEKVLDVKLDTSPSQIVIEGSITNIRGTQAISITRSVAYTESNKYPPVTGANVTVSDNAGSSWNFTETQPGIYTFGSLRGLPGRTYTLQVTANNSVYTASSTMPSQVNMDSIAFRTFVFGGKAKKQVQVFYLDPSGRHNQYRFVAKRNGVLIKQIFTDNDRFTNGRYVSNVLFNDGDDLVAGDVVHVEMQCIDEPVYTYWFSLASQSQNGPGGGVAPNNPPSNISNNALGYFSAHTSQTFFRSVD